MTTQDTAAGETVPQDTADTTTAPEDTADTTTAPEDTADLGDGPVEGALGFGELVLLVDQKGRNYMVRLIEGKEFGTHSGVVPHHSIVGVVEGAQVTSTKGQRFQVYRPSLSDYILNMRRGAQVIYPKDIGPILMLADIGPGNRVFESGVGSGALSMAMLRCGATITGYEIREDFAARARKNVVEFLGEHALERYDVQIRSSYEPIERPEGGAFDRVVLDLPEPWQVVPHIAEQVRPGAILVSYSPSITQVTRARNALEQHGFDELSTTEVLNRTWHIEGAAVRPDHRMVAHTGFLTRSRLLAPPGQ